MGLQLHETVYGKNFFEYQLPKLTEAIENLSENIKRQKDSEGTEKEDLAPEKRKRCLQFYRTPKKRKHLAGGSRNRWKQTMNHQKRLDIMPQKRF